MAEEPWEFDRAERLREEILWVLSDPVLMTCYGGSQQWEAILFEFHYGLQHRIRRQLPTEEEKGVLDFWVFLMKEYGIYLPFHRYLIRRIPRYPEIAVAEARRFKRDTLGVYGSSIGPTLS